MAGKGAWRDSVFVDGIWKSIECGGVYPRAFDPVSEAGPRSAGISISTTVADHNSRLGRGTPDQAYFNHRLLAAA